MSRNGVVSAARSRAARTHAGRSWDCPCGRRVWGNGGKASHTRACVVALQDLVDVHVRVAESGALSWPGSQHHRDAAADWQLLLNDRVERERVA